MFNPAFLVFLQHLFRIACAWPPPCRSAPAGPWWAWPRESCSAAPGRGGCRGCCDSRTRCSRCDRLSSSPLPESRKNKRTVRSSQEGEYNVVIEKQNEPSVMAKYIHGIFSGVCVCVCVHSSPLSSLESRPWSYYRPLPESPLSALHTTHHCSALPACNAQPHTHTDPIIYKAILPKLYRQATGMAHIPKTCITQHKWELTSPERERGGERAKQKQRGRLTWCGGCR